MPWPLLKKNRVFGFCIGGLLDIYNREEGIDEYQNLTIAAVGPSTKIQGRVSKTNHSPHCKVVRKGFISPHEFGRAASFVEVQYQAKSQKVCVVHMEIEATESFEFKSLPTQTRNKKWNFSIRRITPEEFRQGAPLVYKMFLLLLDSFGVVVAVGIFWRFGQKGESLI